MPDDLKVVSSQPLPSSGLKVASSQPLPDNDPYRGAAQATSIGPSGGMPGPIQLAMDKGVDFLADATESAGKAALSTAGGLTELTGELINKIPGVGEFLSPHKGLEGLKSKLQTETAPDPNADPKAAFVGRAAEETAEWVGGDEALKALSKLGKVAKHAPHLLELAEKYPTTTKLILGAGKGAVVGGAQAAVKAPARGEEPSAAAVKGAEGGAVGGAVGEGIASALESKLARGLVNRSVGATARDVTYGNPAKALLDEGIKSPVTGDIEAYKDALRAGKSEVEAAQAAGGRVASVSAKINEVEPQLEQALKASKSKISVKQAILDPLYDATKEIINNRAMTETEKDAAIDKIIALQKSLIDGLDKDITPAEANVIKQQIGERVNWGGTTAVTDEVKPVYKSLYGSLKKAVHDAVPEAAEADERLTNLLAARKDLLNLSRKEEVEAGTGPLSGGFKGVIGRIESVLGRFVPLMHEALDAPVTKAAAGVAGEEANLQGVPMETREMLQGLPKVAAGFHRFVSSDGSVHDVPQDKIEHAKQIDPDLKVIE